MPPLSYWNQAILWFNWSKAKLVCHIEWSFSSHCKTIMQATFQWNWKQFLKPQLSIRECQSFRLLQGASTHHSAPIWRLCWQWYGRLAQNHKINCLVFVQMSHQCAGDSCARQAAHLYCSMSIHCLWLPWQCLVTNVVSSKCMLLNHTIYVGTWSASGIYSFLQDIILQWYKQGTTWK